MMALATSTFPTAPCPSNNINGGVSKFNILAHRRGFRPDGEGAVRMVQMVGACG